MTSKATLVLSLAALVSTYPFTARAQAPERVGHGVQLQNIDKAVKPGDDFFLYANGTWLAKTVIPPDRTGINSFSTVADRTDKQVAAIIAQAAASHAAQGSDQRKIADLYAAYMDTSSVERLGLSPIKPQLEAISAIKTKSELAYALGQTLRADVDALNNTNFHTPNLFGLWVAPGFNDPDHYAPYLMQGGLTLPDRAFYLQDSEHMKDIRAKFLTHAATMFRLAGYIDPEARARRVLALETAIAKTHLSLADNEDIHKANNVWLATEFKSNAPGLDWTEYFRGGGISTQRSFYVWQPGAFKGEAALVGSEPLESWKDFLALHLIESVAAVLPESFSDERFAFFGTALSGAQAQRPREQRAMAVVNGVLGDAVGQLYVKQFFPPEAKAKAQAMVSNLLAAFHARLEAIDWMDPKTKAEAIRKLDSLKVGIGYPDHWRSYAGLEVKPDSIAADLMRSWRFDYAYQLSRIGTPVDRAEWCMEPQTVNAVNLPLNNGLNFPAAILQPPFFDSEAPAAYNYGAIGTVIGHEISHTFDSEGAAFDSQGKVRDWWTPADYEHFKQVTGALAAQFDQYEPYPGVHVNGRQTLGEDIADLGGVAASLDAFHRSLHGQPAPVVNGLTGDQQFFMAFGQIWASKAREAAERSQVLTDPHAPGHYRAETVRNFDAWYAAFPVNPGDKLYLAPEQRVHIW